MLMIRPFLQGKPIAATIRVDSDRKDGPGRRARVFSKEARNSNGDLWSVKYIQDVPASLSIYDASLRELRVFHSGEQEPTITASSLDPRAPPKPFPEQPPDEAPVILSGISCHYTQSTGPEEVDETWYSYEYAATVRSIIKITGRGPTIWYLDDVILEEEVDALLSEYRSVPQAEVQSKLWDFAMKLFARRWNPPAR